MAVVQRQRLLAPLHLIPRQCAIAHIQVQVPRSRHAQHRKLADVADVCARARYHLGGDER